jgi:hypothetical protein
VSRTLLEIGRPTHGQGFLTRRVDHINLFWKVPEFRISLYRACRRELMGPQRQRIKIVAVDISREYKWGTICRAEVEYNHDGNLALLAATTTGVRRQVKWSVWAD